MNKKYGEWTVIRKTKTVKGIEYYLCKCSCGTEREINKYNLISNRSTNCGCLRKAHLSNKKLLDLTGHKFGKLTAINRVDGNSKNNKVRWFCQCDCEKQIIVLANSLLTGHTISCGCVSSTYPNKIQTILKEDFNLDCKKEYYVNLRNDDRYDMKYFRFDIYIPSLNAAIEYDGEHHYIPVKYCGDEKKSEEKLKQTQYYDTIKNKYCLDNNISLLRIPYTDKDNLKEKIHNFISTYND